MSHWKQPGDTDPTLQVFDGNYKLTGNLEVEGTLVSAANSVEILRVENTDIANSATDSAAFGFTPSYIKIDWEGYCVHDSTSEAGISRGSTLVTITGTDTATVACSGIHFNDNNGSSRWEKTAGDTTNISVVKGGTDTSDQASITSAMTSWTTSSNTLLWTHTVANTTDASTTITWTLTAYR